MIAIYSTLLAAFHPSFLDIIVLFFVTFAAIAILLYTIPLFSTSFLSSITSSSPRGPLSSSIRLSHHHHVFAPTPPQPIGTSAIARSIHSL